MPCPCYTIRILSPHQAGKIFFYSIGLCSRTCCKPRTGPWNASLDLPARPCPSARNHTSSTVITGRLSSFWKRNNTNLSRTYWPHVEAEAVGLIVGVHIANIHPNVPRVDLTGFG